MSVSQNLVEYAVRDLMKGRKVPTVAKSVHGKFAGSENWALGPGVHDFTVEELEDAIWERLIKFVVDGMSRMKEGMGHFALDATVQHFGQRKIKSFRPELKERVVDFLGHDPFVNDDR